MVSLEIKRKVLGKYLKSRRKSKGIQQEKVANHMGYSSPQFISNYERGLCTPSMKDNNLGKLIEFIDADPFTVKDMLMSIRDYEISRSLGL